MKGDGAIPLDKLAVAYLNETADAKNIPTQKRDGGPHVIGNIEADSGFTVTPFADFPGRLAHRLTISTSSNRTTHSSGLFRRHTTRPRSGNPTAQPPSETYELTRTDTAESVGIPAHLPMAARI